jgi:hypothetical protein
MKINTQVCYKRDERKKVKRQGEETRYVIKESKN